MLYRSGTTSKHCGISISADQRGRWSLQYEHNPSVYKCGDRRPRRSEAIPEVDTHSGRPRPADECSKMTRIMEKKFFEPSRNAVPVGDDQQALWHQYFC